MWPRRRKLTRVHLKDGPSISGFLVGSWSGFCILDVPKLHEAVDQTVALEGRVSIPWANVSFLQALQSTEAAS